MATINSILEDLESDYVIESDKVIKWINRIEGLAKQIMKSFTTLEINVTREQLIYEVTGVKHDYDIARLYLDDVEIPKLDFKELYSGIGCYAFPGDENVSLQFNHETEGTLKVVVEDTATRLKQEDGNKELIIPFPYDEAYEHYVTAHICKSNEDINGYNNNIALYNDAVTRFKNWYLQRKPAEYGTARNYW